MTNKQSEKILVEASRPRTHSETLHVQDEYKPTRRKSADVVDSIGDRLYKVHDVQKTVTEGDDAVGGGQRPTEGDDAVDGGQRPTEGNDAVDGGQRPTEGDDGVGGGQRPTNLDMKPMVNLEQHQKQEAWKSTYKFSKEETDATPCTTPEITHNTNIDSR